MLMNMSGNSENVGVLAAVGAVFFYGMNLYVIKIGTTFLHQLPFVSTALTLAGCILLIMNILRKKSSAFLGKVYLPRLLFAGIIGSAIPMAMVAYATSFSLVSNSFLLQMEAVYSMALSYALLNERISKGQVLLTVSSFVGVALVLTGGVVSAINVGDVFFLCAPLLFQLGHVIALDVLRKVDPAVVTSYRLLIGGLALSVFSIAVGLDLAEFFKTSEGTVITSYLGLSYAFGGSLFYYAVTRINLSKATSIIITYPLLSTMLATITLREALPLVKIAGISIVFLSTVALSGIKSGLKRTHNI